MTHDTRRRSGGTALAVLIMVGIPLLIALGTGTATVFTARDAAQSYRIQHHGIATTARVVRVLDDECGYSKGGSGCFMRLVVRTPASRSAVITFNRDPRHSRYQLGDRVGVLLDPHAQSRGEVPGRAVDNWGAPLALGIVTAFAGAIAITLAVWMRQSAKRPPPGS